MSHYRLPSRLFREFTTIYGWGTFAKLFVEQFTVNEGTSYECPLLATSVKFR